MVAYTAFFMPYEGCHHEGILMAWPGPENANYGKDESARIKSELTTIAKAISDYEPVVLLVHSTQFSEAVATFQSCGVYGVEIKSTDMNDIEFWMRDVAPTFVFPEGSSASGLHGIDFNFNGWGGRYPSANNARLSRQFLTDSNIPRVETSIVLEGGALETDGEGTLLATESSIINGNRNPNISRETIEQELRRLLGVSKIIWVPGLKDYEVTDFHIDFWARFVAPGKVVLDVPGPNQRALTPAFDTTKEILLQATDAEGRRLELVYLPEADLVGGEPIDPDLCLSYVNYLLVNGAVIIPQFGDHQADNKARDIFRALFPDRKVIQVHLKEIIQNGGSIHCVTQQLPGRS
ncbi:hypothetical protein BDV29DRAFT_190345 [Aspergillus leporis]|jgi:agmatine deiminase|uniref:Agmatine deiminase n=1 Tax=Aspergillus leporis TaxID=41062 RepID=A0A5N5X6T8_9EURO|nr:hypothetical protein BDV29DRAFT_190345 [Aspergillus leporis]